MSDYLEVPVWSGDQLLVKAWYMNMEFSFDVEHVYEGSVYFTEECEANEGFIEIDEDGLWEYNPEYSSGIPSSRDLRTKTLDNGNVVLVCDVQWVKNLNTGETWVRETALTQPPSE